MRRFKFLLRATWFTLLALFYPFAFAPGYWKAQHTLLEVWSVRLLQGLAFLFFWLPLTLFEGAEGALQLGWLGATDTYTISFLDYYGLNGTNVAKRIRLWGAQQLGFILGIVNMTSYQAGAKTAYPEITRAFKNGVTLYGVVGAAMVAAGATAYPATWDTVVNAFRVYTSNGAAPAALAEFATGALVVTIQFAIFGQVGGN